MLIVSPHNLNLCLDSQETRFVWNIFEAVQKTRSSFFIGIKTLGYAPIKKLLLVFFLTLPETFRFHQVIFALWECSLRFSNV